jgi:hypothetical protein
MHQILQSLVDVAADPDLVAKVVFSESDLQHKISLLDEGMIVGWSGVVHRLPFLTVEQCAAVLALGTQYEVNPEEDGPYQIPECVLPEFDGSFIDDWTVLAYQGKFRGNWQLAKYTSGKHGVSWHKAAGKWHARIYVHGRCVDLGLHTELSDAIAARDAAEKLHGYHSNHGRIQ